MSEQRWRELEFTALREEILSLGAAERSAVKFYIPAVAVVYAVPYYLSERITPPEFDPSQQAFLWTFCVLVAELLTLAMLQTLFGSVDGARRIGVYIRTAIEPLTSYEMRWESVFHALTQERRQFLSDSSAVGGISILANIFAACGIGYAFLGDRFWWPLVPTVAMTVISCVVLRRIVMSKTARQRYVERYLDVLTKKSYIEPSSVSPAA